MHWSVLHAGWEYRDKLLRRGRDHGSEKVILLFNFLYLLQYCKVLTRLFNDVRREEERWREMRETRVRMVRGP